VTAGSHPAAAGFFRAGAHARLAWGVDLDTSQSGGPHESVSGADLDDPFTARPDLDQVVATEQHGPGLDGNLLVIRRTLASVGDGLDEITIEKIAPSTETETAAVNAARDYLGYTGPRHIRLFLAVDFA
jgi:hypothetical protein